MSLWRMIFTNLRRHRVRTAIGATGIALGVATMLSVVGLLGGAVKMFERILSTNSEMVVFEKNVSDLFFSNVPLEVADALQSQPFVKEVQPVLFTIISAPDRPVITCFGIRASDSRLRKGEWLQGKADDFTDGGNGVVLGERAADFLDAKAGGTIALGQASYPVAGVVRLENGFENGGVFMPLLTCQKAFHKEGVCSVLTKLCNVSLASKFKFKKAVIKEEGGRDMEEEGDDMGDDMDGNADIADMLQGGNNSDDDIEDFTDFGNGGDKNEAADNI